MRRSEILFGPSGDVSCRTLGSGPLKAGETLLRIEIVQPEGTVLDDQRLTLVRRQIETFLATLGDGSRLNRELLVERLKLEVTPDAWQRLLSYSSEQAYWSIQAWVAEAQLASEECRPFADKRFDPEGMLSMLARWASALQFSDIVGLKRDDRNDWRHISANARAQAAFHRRRAKRLGQATQTAGPRPLLARLRSRFQRGERLLVLGLKTAPLIDVTVCGLLDRYAELVLAKDVSAGPARFIPEIASGQYAAVMVLPDVPPGLRTLVERACTTHRLVCASPESHGLADLEACLVSLEGALAGLPRP